MQQSKQQESTSDDNDCAKAFLQMQQQQFSQLKSKLPDEQLKKAEENIEEMTKLTGKLLELTV